jgi:predicted amidohydrolase YtcJ
VTALGPSDEIRKQAGRNTRVVDLRGRSVIPGLIDSHMHAIRAALSYSVEVNWIGVASLDEALERLREAARAAKPGGWLIVAGGWTPEQFSEKRRPTQPELVAAAPDNPVYVQLFYGWAMLTPAARMALNITTDADVPPRGRLDRDSGGNPTGGISGDTAIESPLTMVGGKIVYATGPYAAFEEKR